MARPLGSRYVLDDVIGRGASGQVWRAHDVDGAMFAVKVLRDSIADDADSVSRFVQERKIMVSLQHPNLVRVHDMVVEGETLALVMELVSGGDLRSYLSARGTLSPEEACSLTAQIADGLAAIHAAGILHRDIKPENVLIDTSSGVPVPKITDFSIARIVSSAKTSTMMAGTPSYVAPELFDDQPPTVQSDLYSLGIVLYELLAGVPPFRSDSLLSMMRLHATEPPPRPPAIPDSVWNVIDNLLAKAPSERFGDAASVAQALRAMRLASNRTVPKKSRSEPTVRKMVAPFAEALAANEQLAQVSSGEGSTRVRIRSAARPHQGGEPSLGVPNNAPSGRARKQSHRRWLLIAGAAIVVVLLALALLPRGPSTERPIVFGHLGKIYSVNADGSGLQVLVDGSASGRAYSMALGPEFSPDGTKLAFLRQHANRTDIHVADADGTNEIQLTHSDGIYSDVVPAWSPDGKQIAYNDGGDVHIVNADGANPRRLTRTGDAGRSEWSPDGSHIAYVDDGGIYVMNADGTDPRQLVDEDVWDFDWSPDGSQIAFAASGTVYSLYADDSNPPRQLSTGGYATGMVRWSPDGRSVMFNVWRKQNEVDGDIHVVDADGTRQAKLASGRHTWTFEWSPDSKEIVYTNFGDIYVMGADGGDKRKLANNDDGTATRDPTWGPAS